MTPQVRYQIFISSTYEDLREERQEATQAILEAGNFPSGMELFPASDDTQWELIKRVIEDADYYIVIVAGRYGTISSSGISYTEMEYDYAVKCGTPVLGFVKEEIQNIPSKYVEPDPENLKRLDKFRQKVMSRTCRKFRDPKELGMAVMKSLMHEARVRPRTGWVRANQARSEDDRLREIKMREELEAARGALASLERELRDRAVVDEVPREKLCQGSDLFSFNIRFRNDNKDLVSEIVSISWDDIFRTIGPSMYGYILWKSNGYNQRPQYSFERSLEDFLRLKIIDRVQGRKIDIKEDQIDTCVFN